MTDSPKTSSCACSSKAGPSQSYATDCPCTKRPEESKPVKKKETKNGEFNPQPYTFRLQQLNKGPRVRAPPFHVQLDHTIAVLWHMYREPSNAPDVGHLQWAKHFLQRIRNNHGDMPKDVEVIVKAMDERMLSLYADLSKTPPYQGPSICCSTEPQHCQAKQSVTFTEMVKQRPDVVQQLFCGNPLSITESCSSHIACDCATSKDEMAKYLKQQRAERVRIIHTELKRLQELDKYMGNVGESGTDTVNGKSLKQIESPKKTVDTAPSAPSAPSATSAASASTAPSAPPASSSSAEVARQPSEAQPSSSAASPSNVAVATLLDL